MTALATPYAGQTVALLTQHGKERVIAPALEPALGCTVQRIGGFDTDTLGTFTRDVQRPGSQLDAARLKARTGMALSGLPLGVASEGSFGPDPVTGLFPWNVELLLWVDERLGLEVQAVAQGPAKNSSARLSDWEALERWAQREDFPAHHLVLRPDGPEDGRIHKGLADWAALRAAFEDSLRQSASGQVWVETDLRAFANPTRMARIAEAARMLAQRLRTPCPVCAAPGFGCEGTLGGLPCAACGAPTHQARAELWRCGRCAHREERPRADRLRADPAHCPLCNP